MRCYDPVLCYHMDGHKVFRNWSFARDSVYLRCIKPDFVFNCEKCLFCRKRRSIELAARCVLHGSLYLDNMFLTLTYDESKKTYHNNFEYKDIQLFKKRYRQHVFRHWGTKVDIFNVHEYGKNGKKHWHLMIFGHNFPDRKIITTSNGLPLSVSFELKKLWPYGHHAIGDLSEASAMYQAQYMEKDFKNRNTTSKKKSHSKHSGLARPYFLKHYSQILRNGFVPFNGYKLPLPRYFIKLAHKHYCHYYEPSAFHDIPSRKALYRPFKENESNKEIADLFANYKLIKQERILELEKEFEEVILSYLDKEIVPDFVASGANAEYDLLNKLKQERF